MVVLRFSFCFTFFFLFAEAQVEKEDAYLLKSYSRYFETPREYAYAHLNKTVLLSGESLGFTVYITDDYKKPSLTATNLYCTITDLENNIIKKKLMMVQGGHSSNVFEIDSTLVPGRYKFNAYTNWMLNFKEPLHFSEDITVLGEDVALESKNEVAKLDVQIFPEGGHLLKNIENVLGVLVKNQFGKGLDINEGFITNQRNDTITRFTLDKFGIGRANLRPLEDEQYFVEVSYGSKQHKIPIKQAEDNGFLLSISKYFDGVLINVKTNLKTLPKIKDNTYILALHNGTNIRTWTYDFSKGPKLELVLEADDLFSGINIFTVFDQYKNPILERLYFNYDDLPVLEPSQPVVTKGNDSLEIALRLPKALPGLSNNISVSVLPKNSLANTAKDNILSNLFLKPYVKGFIENASYYFDDLSKTTKYDLDNLLLTQGWSSFDWTSIFGPKLTEKYAYEQGISFKVNLNAKFEAKSFMVQPLQFTKTFLFNLESAENYFEVAPLYPIKGEQLKLSAVSNNGKLSKPVIIPSFSPNRIPSILNTKSQVYLNKSAELISSNPIVQDLSQVQQLETVEISAVVKRTRYEKLKKLTRGSVDIFDDNKRNAYTDFGTYIASKGFIVNQNVDRVSSQGTKQALLQIYNPTRTSLGQAMQSPLIILNGIIVSNLDLLYNFRMDTVDYIEVDKSGATMGMRGANGVIRIVTDPSVKLKQKTFKEVQAIDIPLSFSTPKDYYIPKYQYYNTPFFEKYGVIAWQPNLKVNRKGAVSVSIRTPQTKEFDLVFQGFVNDKEFISTTHSIKLD